MQDTLLDKIHRTEMDIMREIDRICRKHNLTYFLAYGTLLGAVRHKGFIPWDEDMDIMMPREDYEQFLKVALDELPPHLMIDSYPQNPRYFNPFAKVRNRNTLFAIRALQNYDGPQGLWIDIFPMDYADERCVEDNLKRGRTIGICRAGICIKRGIFDWNVLSAKRKPVYRLLSLLPESFLWKKINKAHLKNKGENNTYVILDADLPESRRPMPIEWFFPPKEACFEGERFLIPANSDAVLTRSYGDYMQIPPKEKQVTFYPMKVMFEDGVVYEQNEKV